MIRARDVGPDAAVWQAGHESLESEERAEALPGHDVYGPLSIVGVYGGMRDPLPMLQLFDKHLTIRMGQLNAQRWYDPLLPLVADPTDPLGVSDLVTHRVSLDQAPAAYDAFQHKSDGVVKVVFEP